jgi:photosystem II stability/assembly factor-like uncharacterized protein
VRARVALLCTLGLLTAACATTPVARVADRLAVPDVLGQPHGTPAVIGQPAPAGTGLLTAVTCAGLEHCWAVGAPAPASATGSAGVKTGAGATQPAPSPVVIDATANGGQTWAGQPLALPTTPSLTAIACPRAQECMAVGSNGALAPSAIVLTTGDGGAIWNEVSIPAGAVVITGVACTSDHDCTVVASDGTTVWTAHSSDFGRSWQREGNLPAGMADAGGLWCRSDGTCLASGYSTTTPGHGQGAIVISVDGGATWAAASVPAGTGLLQDVACPSAFSCLAVGTTSTTVSGLMPAAGKLLQSADGGHTWSPSLASPPIGDVSGIDCPSPHTCVIVGTKWIGQPPVGTGAVARSADGGTSFVAATTEYTPLGLTALVCPSDQSCIAAGGDTVARITLPAPPAPKVVRPRATHRFAPGGLR